MQWAARSIPAQRRRPARRDSISFEPTLSVDAASSRRSSSGYRPANAPKPRAPVDSTALRRRSTISSAFASETPALSYVFPLPLREQSLEPLPAAYFGTAKSTLPFPSSAATRTADCGGAVKL